MQVLCANKLKIPYQCEAIHSIAPAILPYARDVTNKIGGVLRRASIWTYFKPPRKMSYFLRLVKCNIPL